VATPPAESRIDAVPLLPLSGGAFSVQLHLPSQGPGEGSAGPFFALSEEDEHSRSFLGALKGDAGSLVDFCAVKLVKNAQLKVYKGAPHGMCTTHKQQVNEDLLAFFKAK